MEGYQLGGGKVLGLRSKIGWNKTVRGRVKNSIGNGDAKEVTCMTHEHELRGWIPGGKGDTGRRRVLKIGITVIP